MKRPTGARPGSAALSATGIGVRVGRAQILSDVDLDVHTGEVVALVGPNGAGKSTLLGVLAGDVVPDAGVVALGGRPLRDWATRDLARERSVLLQKQGLAFGFRVRDVVGMGRSPWYRTPQEEDDDRVVEESMRSADIASLGDRLFPTLSGGEQARTTFARVLAQKTPVLLLDEPTAALDIRHQEALLGTCRDLARRGTAVVVVLHDLSLAAAYADRVVILAAGRVRSDGGPATVLTPALLSEVYGHPVDVVEHRGSVVVLPVRPHSLHRDSADPQEVPCSPAP